MAEHPQKRRLSTYDKLNDKAFKFLSLMLLAEQPLTTKKLSELVGYPRKTTDLYVTKFLIQGLFIDVGRDGAQDGLLMKNTDRQL